MNHTDCVAANFRANRAKVNETRKVVASGAGVSAESIGNWENGDCMPSVISAWKLADYYGVTLDELVGRSAMTN